MQEALRELSPVCAVSVLRDFYDDTTEDAYVMQYRYQASEVELAPVNRIARLAG